MCPSIVRVALLLLRCLRCVAGSQAVVLSLSPGGGQAAGLMVGCSCWAVVSDVCEDKPATLQDDSGWSPVGRHLTGMHYYGNGACTVQGMHAA
jgi:hypothetical protein